LPISIFAQTNENNTGVFVVSNTTILSPPNDDKDITTQTILGICPTKVLIMWTYSYKPLMRIMG